MVKVHSGESADIRFDSSFSGHVRLDGKMHSFETIKETQLATRTPDGHYNVRISSNDKADAAIGHVSFYFDWIQIDEPLPRPSAVTKEERRLWWLMLLLLLLIPLGLYLLNQFIPEQEPEKPPERIVTLITHEKAAPAKASLGEHKSADGGAQTGEIGKADLKAVEKPSTAQILKKANLGSLVSGLTSLGANAPSAKNAADKTASFNQVGTGGFSTTGLKTGGGGKTVGLGRTVGRGEGGFEGTGHLGLSGDAAVEGGTGYGGGTTVVKGGLSNDIIESIIRRRQYRIRLCYERQLNFNPKLSGKIGVHFVIGKTGQVQSASPNEDTMKSSTVLNCVMSEVKTWVFPAPEGGTLVNVDYPFVFESSAHGQ